MSDSAPLKSNKTLWTSEEDCTLLNLVKQYGACSSWPTIALYMERRSGKQCRERYINQLDPERRRSMWSLEEDTIIKFMHHQFGNKWSKFMDRLPGRSDNAIKNRYHVICRDNFQDLNQRIRASETGTDDTKSVCESFNDRLLRLRTEREILNRQIESLALEPELSTPSLDSSCPPTDFLISEHMLSRIPSEDEHSMSGEANYLNKLESTHASQAHEGHLSRSSHDLNHVFSTYAPSHHYSDHNPSLLP